MNEKNYLIKVIGKTVYTSKVNTVSYIIINIILSVLLIGTTVMYNSLSKLMNDTVNNKIDCRTIFVSDYDMDINTEMQLESVKGVNEHISAVAFQDSAFAVGDILELKTSNRNGQVYIYGCDNTTIPALTKKIDVFPDNYCIIPEKLYADRSIESNIASDLYINGGDYLGKTLTISLIAEHFDGDSTITEIGTVEHEIVVAGTYDTSASFTDDNVCFMPFDYVKMMNESADDGSIKNGIQPILAFVDDIKNVQNVISSLSDAGFRANIKNEMNTSAPKIIKAITDGICLAVYCFCVIISVVVLLGMIKKSKSKIALMKSLGYSNGFILKTYLEGYGILILFGYAIGIICTVITSIVIKNKYLTTNYMLSKMDIVFSVGAITVPLFLLVMIPIFALLFINKKISKISPLELWVNDSL